jgi:NAD(P)-dependent dehydrogenase (short-subunit alcohol dehydrogenase family)
MLLRGQSLLVTGAARGVGEAIACSAAREGARVTAVDNNADGLDGLKLRANTENLEIQTVVADISTREGNEHAVLCAVQAFGCINTFVANAAVIRFADLLATSEEDWEWIHRVNLKGVHLGTQAVIPSLRRAGGGSIVFLASVLGFIGDPLLAAYGATKGALRALCRSIAVGYAADRIRCNTICPGDIETAMLRMQLKREKDPEAARAQLLVHYPLGRLALPDDVANAAIFLASDRASYITGTDLIVDGGLLAKCY